MVDVVGVSEFASDLVGYPTPQQQHTKGTLCYSQNASESWPSKMEAIRVEEVRQALEDKISKLRNALTQWRTREAEYEAFKDELTSLNPDATVEEIVRVGTNFGGDIINEDEIKDLLGYGRAATHRTMSEVQDSLSKRVDVARENA